MSISKADLQDDLAILQEKILDLVNDFEEKNPEVYITSIEPYFHHDANGTPFNRLGVRAVRVHTKVKASRKTDRTDGADPEKPEPPPNREVRQDQGSDQYRDVK